MLHRPIRIIIPLCARAPIPAQARALHAHPALPCREREHWPALLLVEDLHEMEEVVARARVARDACLPLVGVRLARGVVGAAELVALPWGVEVVGVEVFRAVSGEGELVAVGDAYVGEVAGAGGFEDAWRGVRGPRS